MKRDKVVFRVDINANQGLGHYKRCYVLAQHFLMQGWKVYFLMECPCPNADIKTTGINFRYLFDTKNTNAKLTQTEDAIKTLEILKSLTDISCVIVDNYHLDFVWEKALKQQGYFVGAIDDYHDREHCCDLKISDNDANCFEGELGHSMVLLTGLEYVLISSDHCGVPAKKSNKINNILITYGASDLTNETLKALSCIEYLIRSKSIENDVCINVVLGPLDSKGIEKKNFPLIKNLLVYRSPDGLIDLISQADLVFTAGGNTLIECIALRRPTIVTVTADNQQSITDKLQCLDVITVSGQSKSVSWKTLVNNFLEVADRTTPIIEAMERMSLIDCLGAERVYQKIRSLTR